MCQPSGGGCMNVLIKCGTKVRVRNFLRVQKMFLSNYRLNYQRITVRVALSRPNKAEYHSSRVARKPRSVQNTNKNHICIKIFLFFIKSFSPSLIRFSNLQDSLLLLVAKKRLNMSPCRLVGRSVCVPR